MPHLSALRWRLVAGASLTVVLFALAACGGGSEAETDAEGNTVVKLGMFPVADVAPIYLGMEKGFFDDEGLSLDVQLADSGAAVTASVVAGDSDIGFSNPMSLVLAQSQNLPIRVVAPGTTGGATAEEAWSGVIVAADSPIQGAADLTGKTIAVNSLKNILEVTLRTALENEGLDPRSVELIEMPFPDMPAAIENGQADAAFAVEPYITQAVSAGVARVVMTPYESVAPEFPTSLYFSTSQFIDGNQQVVEKFQRALEASVAYAQEHPDEARDIVTDFTEIDPDVVSAMRMPVFADTIDEEKIDLYMQMGVTWGLIEEAGDVEEFLAGWSAP